MPTGPLSPFPALQVWPTSGLTLPWLEWTHADIGAGDAQLGPDGVVWVMQMLCYWSDLPQMLQQLIGYSYRDATGPTPVLRRNLPWQCPWANQLFVKNVSSVKGVLLRGHDTVIGGGVGPGFSLNTGPWTIYQYALLTIHFWRPPYYVRSDQDILIPSPFDPGQFVPAEWLRYTDKHWREDTQLLSRESQTFSFLAGQGPPSGANFQGSVGQKLCHLKVSRRWYEIPEQGIFTTTQDATPSGIPAGLMYMRAPTTNPMTGYFQDPTAPNQSQAFPILGCVNSALNNQDDTDPFWRIWGCRMGTLLLEAVEIIPRPLQLPAYLMGIPNFGLNEPLSQQQYDIEFHFDLFDPPRAPSVAGNTTPVPATGVPLQNAVRGHNLAPWSGDGLWYGAVGQLTVGGAAVVTTPFQYANFYDLFQLI